jgi:hypothetical protein
MHGRETKPETKAPLKFLRILDPAAPEGAHISFLARKKHLTQQQHDSKHASALRRTCASSIVRALVAVN